MYRVRSRTRVLLACAATAGLLVGCGNAPDTKAPDIQTLPSPIAVPLPSPSTTTTTTTPAPTGKPKPASAQPGRRSVQPGNAGAVPVVGAGPGFRAIGGDEFNGGALDTKKWGLYDSVGGFGNGLRRPSAISQSAGSLAITATGETSGGMADSFGQTYGRWEFRARTDHGRGLGSAGAGRAVSRTGSICASAYFFAAGSNTLNDRFVRCQPGKAPASSFAISLGAAVTK